MGTWFFAPASKSASVRSTGGATRLVLLTEFPPRLVVVGRLDFTGEYLPAPLVECKREGQEGYLVERCAQLKRNVGLCGRFLTGESEGLQIRGRDGKRDRVADGLVKTVVGAATEEERLLVVGALIEVVTKLVMHGGEVVGVDLDAHLHAQVVDGVEVPG